MKLANKISLSFSVVLVTLMGISLFTLYMIAKNNLEKAIYEHLRTTAQSRARHIETFLENHKQKIGAIANSALIESILKATVSNDPDSAKLIEQANLGLEQFAQADHQLYEIFIVNSEGKIIVSTNENNIGLDKSTDAYFLGAKEGVYIKDAYYSETTKEYSIVFSVPVLDKETDEFLGVIVARVPLEDLDNITTDRTGLGETGETYLVNKDKYMITHSRFTEGAFLSQKVDTENVKSCFASEAKNIEDPWHEKVQIFSDYRGIRVLGTYAFIPEMKWGLLAEIDVKEALAPLAKIKYFAIITFCFALGTVYGISILISKAITAPIYRLHKGTEKIGAGELDYKVGTNARDEIGQLSRAFDQMTENLKKTTVSRDKLNAANQQLRASEQQLKATNQDLNQSNQALQDFAYIASHDLQEPLRKVLAFGDRLKDSCGDSLEEKGADYLERMQNAAGRMRILINDLLTYSRVTTKAKSSEEVDLGRITNEVLSDLEVTIEEMGAEVEVGRLPILQADPSQMRQLMQNLISNALKFHKPDEASVVKITSEISKHQSDEAETSVAEAEFCRVIVEDNGIGFEQEYADKIFEMFQRLHGRSEYEGTGLGLAVCQKIVHRHDGTITAESSPGKGSRFIITFPTNRVKSEMLQTV